MRHNIYKRKNRAHPQQHSKIMTMNSKTFACILGILVLKYTTAFTVSSSNSMIGSRSSTDYYPSSLQLFAQNNNQQDDDNDSVQQRTRRNLFIASAAVVKAGLIYAATANAADSSAASSLLEDLKTSRSKLEAIPELLKNEEWDSVRTILKTPPVNYLWNMGDSTNTVLKLAKATDEFELIDLKDELAYSLQMTDQFSYDNVFIRFQPGNGKVKIKEPTETVKKAMAQLDEAIKLGKDAVN